MPIGLGYGGYRKIKKPGMKSRSHSVMRSVGKTSNLAFACATGTLQTFAPPRMSDLLLPLIFWHPMKSASFWGCGSIRLADVLGHQHIVRADDLLMRVIAILPLTRVICKNIVHPGRRQPSCIHVNMVWFANLADLCLPLGLAEAERASLLHMR